MSAGKQFSITVSQSDGTLQNPLINERDNASECQRVQGSSFDDGTASAYPSEYEAGPRRATTPLGFLYRISQSFIFQVIMLLVTMTDIGFLVYEFSTGSVRFSTVTLCTSLSFFIELLIVIGYDGFTKHFLYDTKWLVAEAIIVAASFVVEYTEYILEAELPQSWLSGRLRYFRAVRFFRVIIICRTRYHKLVSALRRLVSADRRRYVDDGFDLDLTYVHTNVIAMSWPSTKAESLYRNKIDTVAAFLDTKHPGKYHVYNLCSERGYDESKFHNMCTRFYLDDHNPPELATMLTFAQTVTDFVSKDPSQHIAVIHCKGGKGRTGTMVCSYLIYAKIWPRAVDALLHFGKLRTADTAKSFQGVESPSQDRYVRYFERLLASPSMKAPARRLRISQMRLLNIPIAWWSNGIDRLWFAVILNPSSARQVVYKSNPTVTFDPYPIAKKGGPPGSPPGSPGGPASGNVSREASPGRPGGAPPGGSVGTPSPPRRKAAMGDPSSPQLSDNDDDGSQQQQQPDGCQPFGGNYVISVGDKPGVSLDCHAFDQEYVAGPAAVVGGDALSVASSAVNFLASSARLGGPVRRNLNKDLVVNVEVNTSSIPPLEEDVQLKFFHNVDHPDALHAKVQMWFHCAFERNRLVFERCTIDGPHKEGDKPKKFPRNFAIELQFENVA